MNKRKLIVVEQYISWAGHYKQYFENLISEKYRYIYCSKQNYHFPNSIFLPAYYNLKKVGSFTNFVLGRVLDSIKTYNKVIEEQADVSHLIEFEPLSFLYLLIFKRKRIPKLIITIHSVERMRYTNIIKDKISEAQRKLYRYTLREAASQQALFITHYQHHKNLLISVIGPNFANSIQVINYPCPAIQSSVSSLSNNSKIKFLIYGQIREDKGIYEFLSLPETKSLNITIAGRILDERILKLEIPGLTLINKFMDEMEIQTLTSSHDFMLLPYPSTYTGGAGTLKDSLSYGLPVIASNIPIFKEIISNEKVGFIFNNVSDIIDFTENITENKYSDIASNCLTYAQKYNWDYMRKEYFKLYEDCLNKA